MHAAHPTSPRSRQAPALPGRVSGAKNPPCSVARLSLTAAAVALLAFLSPLPLRAQVSTAATITGTVEDAQRMRIPGAQVTITNTATHDVMKLKSNSDGSFTRVGLPSGRYEVSVTASGFQTFNETGIDLEPLAVFNVNADLQVGAMQTAVNVEASPVAVQTITPEISSTVSGVEAEALPMDGRNYQALGQLMPGVVNTSPVNAMGPGGFATSNYLNVNGGGASGTFYTVDGIWNENTGNMTQTTITPVPDSIAEIKILQNNYDPKYTLMGASVMVVQTRSGTSQFHGGAWEFLRNTFLDARNFFAPVSQGVLPEEWNIYGYHLGGPLFIPKVYNTNKQRTFFYWSQQWLREKQQGLITGQTPLAAMRGIGTPNNAALFSMTGTYGVAFLKDPSKSGSCNASSQAACFGNDGNGNWVIPAGRINSSQLALLNAMAPLPNYTTINTTNYVNTKPNVTNQRDEEAKIDHFITPRFHLMGELLWETQDAYNANAARMGSPFSTNYDTFFSNNKLAQVQLTQVYSSTMANDTAIAMNNYVITHEFGGNISVSQIQGYSQTLPFTGGYLEDRLPHITFANGWSQFGTSANNTIPDATDLEDTVSDNWSWLHGKHFIEAGGEIVFGTKRQWSTVANTTGDVNFNGYASGNPIADYLLGLPNSFVQGQSGVRKYIHYTITSPYVQDRWNVTRRLTLTGGVRFFRMPFPGSQPGYSANFNPALFNPANVPTVASNGVLSGPSAVGYVNGIELDGENGVPVNITNEHNYYIAPMGGFAYDLFGDGKTSVRGGFGIAYNRNGGMGEACSQLCVSFPILSQTNLTDPTFPNVTGGTAAPPTASSIAGMPHDYRVAMIKTWSLSVQQQFPGSWLLGVAGAGNNAVHLNTTYNLNQPMPVNGFDFNPNLNLAGYSSAYYAPYQGYGNINWSAPAGYSNWNALEVSLKHPAGHHVYVTVAYTWSHNLDNTSSGFQNPYDLHSAYGNSTLNVPHVFTASVIYTMPFFQGDNWKHAVLGGWKISDMTTIQSGSSLNLGITGSNLGPITRPDVVGVVSYPKTWKPFQYGSGAYWFNPGTASSPVFARPANGHYGNAGNGVLRGPGVAVYNMALYKDFPIFREMNLQFRAEYFNVFNHTNPNNPATTFGSGNFGFINSAMQPRTGELSLKLKF